jgi:hypothetical protein
MTTQQLLLMTGAYSVLLIVVIYFTRPTARRLTGALVGSVAVGLMLLGIMALGNTLGLWRVPFASTPYFLPLMCLALVISDAPVYLVTWRVTRRFGWKGFLVFLAGVAVIGPLRDYRVAAAFPEWMVIAPGIAPVFAIAVTYVAIVAVGHAVMRWVAGPARGDLLAARPHRATKTIST